MPDGVIPDEGHLMPKRKASHYALRGTMILAGISALMMGLALPSVIGGDDLFTYLKSALLGGAAWGVIYCVNRLSIERAAPLAAARMPGVAPIALSAMLAVGGGVSVATYAGFVYDDVERLELADYSEASARYDEGRISQASNAARVGSTMGAIVADLNAKRDCEQRISCISSRGNGGLGRVTRALEQLQLRAAAVAAQVYSGEREREAAIKRLMELRTAFQAVLNDPELTTAERRKQLLAIESKRALALNELDESVPTALVLGYTPELRSGTLIEGRPAATRKINSILSGYAEGLTVAMNSVVPTELTRPPFPARTGVVDTLAYAGSFIPVLLLVIAVDLIFPVFLWVLTYLSLVWNRHRLNPAPPEGGPEFGSFEELVSRPLADQPEEKKPARGRPRKSETS